MQSREPFLDLLKRLLEAEREVRAHAGRHPDGWDQLATMIARLSIYTDKPELDNGLPVSQLSDSQLFAQFNDRRQWRTGLPEMARASGLTVGRGIWIERCR